MSRVLLIFRRNSDRVGQRGISKFNLPDDDIVQFPAMWIFLCWRRIGSLSRQRDKHGERLYLVSNPGEFVDAVQHFLETGDW